jgi:hypothetical protein
MVEQSLSIVPHPKMDRLDWELMLLKSCLISPEICLRTQTSEHLGCGSTAERLTLAQKMRVQFLPPQLF